MCVSPLTVYLIKCQNIVKSLSHNVSHLYIPCFSLTDAPKPESITFLSDARYRNSANLHISEVDFCSPTIQFIKSSYL